MPSVIFRTLLSNPLGINELGEVKDSGCGQEINGEVWPGFAPRCATSTDFGA
jgi:hypothetical protein